MTSGGTLVIERDDPRDHSHARTALRPSILTWNIILLTILFAANDAPWAPANIGRYLLSCGILFGSHVLAVVANVESIYALQLGAWSDQHYNAVEKNFWGASAHFFDVVGAAAIAVLLWFLFGRRKESLMFPTVGH